MEEDDSEMNEIRKKYIELCKRITDIQIISEVIEDENDALLYRKKHIENKDTCLKSLLEFFTFEDIDLKEIQSKKRILDEMNKEHDFSYLPHIKGGKLFANHNKLNEIEKEYMEVSEYLYLKQYSKYIFCYNSTYQPTDNAVFEELFNQQFNWNRLKWSIFGFGISKEEFEKNVSETVKKEMYCNRIIL